MFGLSWLFGALTIIDAEGAFDWLFVIFNTLQGFFLFVFFCVIGKDARDEWLNVLRCGRKKDTRSSTGPTSSHSRSTIRKSRPITEESHLTSHHRSRTLLRGAGMSPTHDLDSSVTDKKALELTSMGNGDLEPHSPVLSEAGETELVIANGLAHEEGVDGVSKVDLAATPPRDVQVPPHVLAKLRGPYYQVHEDERSHIQTEPPKSSEATPTFGEEVKLEVQQEEQAVSPTHENPTHLTEVQVQLEPLKEAEVGEKTEAAQDEDEAETTKDDVPLVERDVQVAIEEGEGDRRRESFHIELDLDFTQLTDLSYEPSAADSDDDGTHL